MALFPSPPHHYEQVKLLCAAASGRKDSPALHEVIPVQDFLPHIVSLQPPWKLKARELTTQKLGEKKSLEEGKKIEDEQVLLQHSSALGLALPAAEWRIGKAHSKEDMSISHPEGYWLNLVPSDR